jgi:hypothetical protein
VAGEQVSVPHRHLRVAVAEQLLDGAKVNAAITKWLADVCPQVVSPHIVDSRSAADASEGAVERSPADGIVGIVAKVWRCTFVLIFRIMAGLT